MKAIAAAGLLCASLVTPLFAQEGLQSPEDFLGYVPGEHFTEHHRVLSYFQHVAEIRPTVVLQDYGLSTEGRPLVLAILASEENIARLEDIRINNLRRAHREEGTAEAGPAIVWLSYNVHGNEAVSTEAAMKTLHALADPTNTQTQSWLDNTVVIIDPCLNPDGRQRYVGWYKQATGYRPNPNPAAREHNEPWPGGRTNHYYFDLNRDWVWQVQRESQQRMAAYRKWMPQVHVDFHEQGMNDPYYFAPAAEPYHDVVTDFQRRFQKTIGENNARYFDAEGWLYFTRERFDLLYPSYGDTWPTFNGAVGMTYEQGGSGRAGLAIEVATGDTLTLTDRIAHHHATGLSTVETTARHADEVVAAYAAYHDAAVEGDDDGYQTYVFRASNNTHDLHALIGLLKRQGIQVGMLSSDDRVESFSYRSGALEDVEVKAGDVAIRGAQPSAAMVRALFEPATALADSMTYDITAWSLPYVFGLEAYATREAMEVVPFEHPERQETDAAGPLQAYAYVAAYTSLGDQKFLAKLLEADVRVRYASKPFVIGGKDYKAGTLIILRADNRHLGAGFDERVGDVASRHQEILPVETGLVDEGSDFGSSSVRFIEKPTIAVLSGENVFSSAFGEIWHFFEQQIGYPVTVLDAGSVDASVLADIDVLVLPNGSYAGVLGQDGEAALTSWVRAGGRLVAFERAVQFLSGVDGFGIRNKNALDEDDPAGDTDPALLRKYDDRLRDRVSTSVTGSIFAVDMDTTHPLGFGFEDRYFTLKRSDEAYAFLERGWNVGVLAKDGYRSGFTGVKAMEKLDDGLLFGVESLGNGSVVYLVDNPLFRGFWHKGKMLVGNAAFLVGQ